ncbi:MAG: hypothetical protein WBG43_10360 [Marinifilaceae bacterium]
MTDIILCLVILAILALIIYCLCVFLYFLVCKYPVISIAFFIFISLIVTASLIDDDCLIDVKKLSEDVRPNFNKDFSKIAKFSLAARNNNPGNLRHVGSISGFREFSSMQAGYSAMVRDLKAKISGKSRYTDGTENLSELIHIYAPPSENDTRHYVAKVAGYMGVKRDIATSKIDVYMLAKAMIKVEDSRLFKLLFE